MAEFNQFGAVEDENAEIKKLELEVVRASECLDAASAGLSLTTICNVS